MAFGIPQSTVRTTKCGRMTTMSAMLGELYKSFERIKRAMVRRWCIYPAYIVKSLFGSKPQ